jgi:hypothetical protein
MALHDDPDNAFLIDVRVRVDAASSGYVARLSVRQLPALRMLLCEDILACGTAWTQPHNAVAAAYARGRKFVSEELYRRHVTAVLEDESVPNDATWPDDVDAMGLQGAEWPSPDLVDAQSPRRWKAW